MTVLTQVSQAVQTVLTTEARRAAGRCRVIQQRRKLDGARLIQGLVLGWMEPSRCEPGAVGANEGCLRLCITPHRCAIPFAVPARPRIGSCLSR
jgi:hypothetical protein